MYGRCQSCKGYLSSQDNKYCKPCDKLMMQYKKNFYDEYDEPLDGDVYFEDPHG